MNHVWPVAIRFAGSSLRCPPWSRDQAVLRGVLSWVARSAHTSSLLSHDRPSSAHVKRQDPLIYLNTTLRKPVILKRCLRSSGVLRKLRPYKESKHQEKGLKFRAEPLSLSEVEDVFGPEPPDPVFANRLLTVLYGRMVDGTLDLPPPTDIQQELQRYPDTLVPSALQWLQVHYPVDEEEAIDRRIKREEASSEQQSPSQLIQRAEDLGLYKPQSGHYHAPLSEKEGDPYGRSELDQIRAENIARAEQEEQELEKQIEEIQNQVRAKQEQQANKDTALTSRNEQGLEPSVPPGELRPLNEFEKWVLRARNRATSNLTLDSPEVAQMSKTRRLLPPLFFTIAVSLLCYAFAQTWVPPRRSDRIMHDTSLGFATIAGIFALNIFVWWAWKFPPAWRILNRYFISVPGQPRAFAMLGNVFSHQSLSHLLVNTVWIVIPGLGLHEDVGRGTFLGLYIASGIWGSWISLANFVTRGVMVTSTLGASGAAAGVVSAYCVVHAWDNFTIKILPSDWQDKLKVPGWVILTALLISETVGYLGPLKRVDYASHLAGYAVGGLCAWRWRTNREREGEWPKPKGERRLTWFERIVGPEEERK